MPSSSRADCGYDAAAHAKETEFRIRRPLELLIREDLAVSGVIYRYQLNLVQVRYLAQLLSDADVVVAIQGRERFAPGMETYSS